MLHYISDTIHPSLEDWCISRKTFLKLLNYIDATGHQTITFADIVADENILKTSSKKVILTFDDCPRHLFDFALPEMKKRNIKAVFYLPTAHIGGYNDWDIAEGRAKLELMNEAEIKALDRMGMEIGAHSHHHIKLRTLDNKKIKEEVVTSKRIIENITQKTVFSFAYPFASVPDNCQQILTEVGYHFGLSIYQPFEHLMALRRFGIYELDTEKTIKLKLSKQYKWMRRLYDPFKKYNT